MLGKLFSQLTVLRHVRGITPYLFGCSPYRMHNWWQHRRRAPVIRANDGPGSEHRHEYDQPHPSPPANQQPEPRHRPRLAVGTYAVDARRDCHVRAAPSPLIHLDLRCIRSSTARPVHPGRAALVLSVGTGRVVRPSSLSAGRSRFLAGLSVAPFPGVFCGDVTHLPAIRTGIHWASSRFSWHPAAGGPERVALLVGAGSGGCCRSSGGSTSGLFGRTPGFRPSTPTGTVGHGRHPGSAGRASTGGSLPRSPRGDDPGLCRSWCGRQSWRRRE